MFEAFPDLLVSVAQTGKQEPQAQLGRHLARVGQVDHELLGELD
jgi:hypothetical protein